MNKMASKKVALITGGASGMGLMVTTLLSKRPDWTIHILDLNPDSGQSVASSLGSNVKFHECNVTDDASLNSIFKTVFEQDHRLDFVFANAGIAERANFFEQSMEFDDPPLPVAGMHALVDINLKSVITTTYLALHYMRKSPADADMSIVMTASCGGIYPSYYSPIYTATKHAVVGMMRSISPYFYQKAGIRVNAILPGTVKTNLLSSQEWTMFPEEYFTPVEKIGEVVCMLVDGKDNGTGQVGKEVTGGMESVKLLNGRAVEISGRNHYYREAVAFADAAMEAVMGSTNVTALKQSD